MSLVVKENSWGMQLDIGKLEMFPRLLRFQRNSYQRELTEKSVCWEPEGRYQYSKMFRWEPEGRYRCINSMKVAPFCFSTEHLLISIAPFWLSADDLCRFFHFFFWSYNALINILFTFKYETPFAKNRIMKWYEFYLKIYIRTTLPNSRVSTPPPPPPPPRLLICNLGPVLWERKKTRTADFKYNGAVLSKCGDRVFFCQWPGPWIMDVLMNWRISSLWYYKWNNMLGVSMHNAQCHENWTDPLLQVGCLCIQTFFFFFFFFWGGGGSFIG